MNLSHTMPSTCNALSYFLAQTSIAFPVINILHQRRLFVTIYEPTLTCYYHWKSIFYTRVNSWCCTFYEFGQFYNDMYALFWYHIEWFHCSKNSLHSTYLSLLPPKPKASTVCIVLPFPECLIVGITQYVVFFGWLLSLSNTYLRFLHVFSWSGSSLPLALNNIPLSGYTTVYLPIHLLKDILFASKF